MSFNNYIKLVETLTRKNKLKLFLAILALISTLSAMETEDGVNADDPALPRPGSKTVLHLQIFEKLLDTMKKRRDFNQELLNHIQDTNTHFKERIAEFEEQSGRKRSSNKRIDRFKNYTNMIETDLKRYEDLISEVTYVISSTNSQEREDAANYLYAYLQWTKKTADTVLVENADENFHEVEFYKEMIGQLERLQITDAYKNFHHYIIVRANNTNRDGIECPEYTTSIIASMRKIDKIHDLFSKAVEVLVKEMQTCKNSLQYFIYINYINNVQNVEFEYEELEKKYDQTLENLRSLAALAAVSNPYYSSKKAALRNVPSIMREIQALKEISEKYQSFEERFQSLLDHQIAQNVLNRLEAEEELKKTQSTPAKNNKAEKTKERLRKKLEDAKRDTEERKAQESTTDELMLKLAATDENSRGAQTAAHKNAKKKNKSKKGKK